VGSGLKGAVEMICLSMNAIDESKYIIAYCGYEGNKNVTCYEGKGLEIVSNW